MVHKYSAALYFLNREAVKQVKVCLSGEVADELYGGYYIYQEYGVFICFGFGMRSILSTDK